MKAEKIEDANLLRMDIAQITGLEPFEVDEIHEKYVRFININYQLKTDITQQDFILNS